MLVDFEMLSDSSKVWVYQADRTFTADEMPKISEKLKVFISEWTGHGNNLRGAFKVMYNQFIVLAVDENYNDVSGCSIDASVHAIKDIGNEFGVDLLNKMNVSFKDGDNINTVRLKDFKEFVKQRKITADTVVFNNMVGTKADFDASWEVKASESWHSRFLV